MKTKEAIYQADASLLDNSKSPEEIEAENKIRKEIEAVERDINFYENLLEHPHYDLFRRCYGITEE